MRTKKSPSNSSSATSLVDRWLSEMSLAEQIGQMSQIDINMLLEDDGNGGKRLSTKLMERYIGEMAVGSVLNSVSSIQWTARQYREAAIALNQVAARYHRPPVIWGLDSVHGANYIKNAILTPQPINIAATWNITASFVAGELASRDTRAAGIHWLFSPLIGLATQPRWSRVYETFGEDPLLTGDMARAMIDGIQQPDDTSIPSRAAACAKHFIGYSMPRTGHDRSPSWIPTRHLYQYFVPPWKRALMDNGAKTVMESYTETDGVPMAGNRDKLNYLLRYRLNFTGVLVTDYEEIRNLHNWHHTAPSDQDAIIYALREGSVDVSMIPWDANGFATSIVAGIQSQQLSPDRIRESAARVLALKESLNMFEETMTIVEPHLDMVGNDEDSIMHVVHESIILAENKNSVLPLDPNRSLNIQVTGPTANSLIYQSGGWTWQWQGSPSDDWFTYGKTVVDALHTVNAWTVTYTCGVNILGKECDDPDESGVDESIIDQVKHWVGLTPTTSIARAVQGAKQADFTIICLGEEAYTEKPGDIRSLRLPDGQYDLVHAIARNTDTRIVVVYFGGRPRLLADIVDEVDAVILGFLPGPSAGTAVIDIITGESNPSGRLPITYPLSDDGGGSPYWHAITDQCTEGEVGSTLPHYDYVPCNIQWPFGHGLSYTSFEYSEFSVTGGIDDDLQLQINVKNSGSRTGSDTVMFFTFDEFRRTTPEYKQLRAFEKLTLQPGESKTLTKVVSLDTLKFIGPDDDTHYIIDPSMTSYIGAGYKVDCRQIDDSNDPTKDDNCKRVQSNKKGTLYFPACVDACNIWHNSKCVTNMTQSECREMCVSAFSEYGNENYGWGWNYVNCIERVLWQVQKDGDQSDKDNCAMMRAFCRDIFHANITGSVSHLQAPTWPSQATASDVHAIPLSFYVAFTSCLLSAILIAMGIRGQRANKNDGIASKRDDPFRGIQFTTVSNNNLQFD
jgi:beta-glucosidase